MAKQVLLYETEWCHWCKLAKEFFKNYKIKFKEIYVDKDQKAANEMIEKSGQMGVPVIDIDSKIVIGFDEPALKKLLKIK